MTSEVTGGGERSPGYRHASHTVALIALPAYSSKKPRARGGERDQAKIRNSSRGLFFCRMLSAEGQRLGRRFRPLIPEYKLGLRRAMIRRLVNLAWTLRRLSCRKAPHPF